MARDPKEAPAAPRTDAYEAEYMKGEAPVLHREKVVWRHHYILLAPLVLVALSEVLVLAGVGNKPAPPWVGLLLLLPAALLIMSWLLFSVLRVHVTRRHVHIQYGPFGPKIPVDAIESCQAMDYDVMKYGGWGLRLGRDGSWAYSLLGEGGRVVQIVWREDGKEKKVVVSSRDPEALVQGIQSARAAAGGHRIVVDGADALASTVRYDPTEEAQAEAEAAAIEARRAQR